VAFSTKNETIFKKSLVSDEIYFNNLNNGLRKQTLPELFIFIINYLDFDVERVGYRIIWGG